MLLTSSLVLRHTYSFRHWLCDMIRHSHPEHNHREFTHAMSLPPARVGDQWYLLMLNATSDTDLPDGRWLGPTGF